MKKVMEQQDRIIAAYEAVKNTHVEKQNPDVNMIVETAQAMGLEFRKPVSAERVQRVTEALGFEHRLPPTRATPERTLRALGFPVPQRVDNETLVQVYEALSRISSASAPGIAIQEHYPSAPEQKKTPATKDDAREAVEFLSRALEKSGYRLKP